MSRGREIKRILQRAHAWYTHNRVNGYMRTRILANGPVDGRFMRFNAQRIHTPTHTHTHSQANTHNIYRRKKANTRFPPSFIFFYFYYPSFILYGDQNGRISRLVDFCFLFFFSRTITVCGVFRTFLRRDGRDGRSTSDWIR